VGGYLAGTVGVEDVQGDGETMVWGCGREEGQPQHDVPGVDLAVGLYIEGSIEVRAKPCRAREREREGGSYRE